MAGERPSSTYYFVSSQADSLFYLDPCHPRATIPLRPPTQAPERGIPIRQATPETCVVPPVIVFPRPRRRPVAQAHLLFHLKLHRYSIIKTVDRQLLLGRSTCSLELCQCEWWQVGIDGRCERRTQMHYVTSYSGAELRTFHCERVRKMPLCGLDPSVLIGLLCKTEADWIDLRRSLIEVRSIVVSP